MDKNEIDDFVAEQDDEGRQYVAQAALCNIPEVDFYVLVATIAASLYKDTAPHELFLYLGKATGDAMKRSEADNG